MEESSGITIDKSLARGLFNQEVRLARGDLLGELTVGPRLNGDDLDEFFLHQAFSRMARGRPSFPVNTYRPLARALAAKPLKPCEALFQAQATVVQASSNKSYLEVCYRTRPILDEDILSSASCYAFVKKDRMVIGRRTYPVVATGHAIRRYLQRGDVRIGEPVLAPVMAEIFARTGLFLFLANLSGRHAGARFAVPFKEGFLLCEIERSQMGAAIEYLLPDDPDMERFEIGDVRQHCHPLLWGSEDGTRLAIKANTYVGRREMKDGQVALHDLLEGVYQRARKEIDLIGMAETCFYPGHLPGVTEQLSKAARRLDEAVNDVKAALRFDRRLAFAFIKEDFLDDREVRMPSSDVALARKGIDWVAGMMEATGLSGRGGGPFCHAPEHGLYGGASASAFGGEHVVSRAFTLDPYEDVPSPEEMRVMEAERKIREAL